MSPQQLVGDVFLFDQDVSSKPGGPLNCRKFFISAKIRRRTKATVQSLCEGQKPIVVHAASAIRDDHYSGTMPISEQSCCQMNVFEPERTSGVCVLPEHTRELLRSLV